MDCACVYVDTDCDGPTVHTAEKRKARKPHKCTECRRVISHGETYLHEKGLWEGRWETYKTCAECLEIRNEFFCDGWLYGEVMTDFREYVSSGYGDVSESKIADLSPSARTVVCGVIEAYWEDHEEDD